MKKPWSISTTVRNPDRLRGFLRALKIIEGQPFNSDNQIKYQILLIQNRLYEPTKLNVKQKEYFDSIEKEMPFYIAEEIFNAQGSEAEGYKDPAMRGRNSVAPLNKMGLCIAKNSVETVRITPLGEYFLSEDYDLGKLFFSHFLKWQLPNPASRAFSEGDGFAIMPFIGTLHLIKESNKKWAELGYEPVGISKDEFSLFAPTLIDYKDIKKQAVKLIEYRLGIREKKDEKSRNKFKENFRENFARAFLNTRKNSEITKLLNNLKDYGDNAIRYFRLTRYINIRGNGFYVDLEPRRSIEIDKLLSKYDGAPLLFKNANEYIEYLADIEQPVLPWETKTELTKIAEKLSKDTQNYIFNLKSKSIMPPSFNFEKIDNFISSQLKIYIEELRNYRRKLQELEASLESQNTAKIQEYINALRSIHKSRNKKSIELEKLVTLSLKALNDALEIKPNYPVGDDNEPTFTAPGNMADIECFYKKFNSVCEVTLLKDRSQWYNEGQPVMRHVRDFEGLYSDKITYCLFIAPELHRDTAETFWMAIKYGYRGATQRIIPLSITQFIKLLEILLEVRNQGRKFNHYELLELYEQILEFTKDAKHSAEWVAQIPDIINLWQKSVLKGENFENK